MRKVIVLMMVLCMFGLANAAVYTWTGDGDGISWSDGDNWDLGTVPSTDEDSAVIEANDLTIDVNVPEVMEIIFDTTDSNVSTGTLTISGVWVNITGPGSDTGIGPHGSQDEPFLINYGGKGIAVVNINNGAIVNVGDDGWRSGDEAESLTTFNITGPDTTVTSTDNFRFADHGVVNVNITNGASAKLDNFRFGDNNDGFCNLLIDDSEIDCQNLQIGDDGAAFVTFTNTTVFADEYSWNGRRAKTDSKMTLNDSLVVFTDRVRFVADGTQDGGDASLFIETNGNSTLYCKGELNMVVEDGHPVEVNLVEGTFAGNEVNFGLSADYLDMEFVAGSFYAGGNRVADINELITAGVMRIQDGSGSNLVGPNYMSAQDITFLGGVPDKRYAHGFVPYNQMVDSLPGSSLQWLAADGADNYNVYWGETSPPDFLANVSGTTLAVDSIPSGVYYYRVDANDGGVIYAGPELKYFATKGKATNPVPGDGDEFAPSPIAAMLEWTQGGPWVEEHVIYFGTDEDAVADANTSSDEYLTTNIGNGANTVSVGVLELGTDYYWRVDEQSTEYLVPGDVWSFTTADHFLIDDFESYNAVDNKIYDTWIEQGNAIVRLDDVIVHGGDQAMGLDYYGDSSAKKSFASSDFTSSDVKALVMYFYGEASNDADLPYAALSSGVTVEYDGVAADTAADEWIEWNIDMADFGATLTGITSVTVGMDLNDDDNAGILYVDNIRLYQSRCVPEFSGLTADFNEDCKVDGDDLGELADTWLDEGWGLVTSTAPDAGKLQIRYTFETDSAGSAVIADSSTNGYNGTWISDSNETPLNLTAERLDSSSAAEGSVSFKFIDNDLVPEGYAGIMVPDAACAFADDTQEITVSMWIVNNMTQAEIDNESRDSGVRIWAMRMWEYDDDEWDDTVVLEAPGDDQNEVYSLEDDDEDISYEAGPWEDQTDWANYIYVKDTGEEYLAIYKDGVLVAYGDSDEEMEEPTLIMIGCGADRAPDAAEELNDGMTGNIDDFRIYSYAVSPAEALGIAGAASHFYDIADQPFNSPADLVDDNKINFADYAGIADEWMDEVLWP